MPDDGHDEEFGEDPEGPRDAADRDAPRRGNSGAGRGRARADEYDDDDDYDDYVPPRRDDARRRRDIWLVVGAAALIVIAVLVIVVKGSDSKKSSNNNNTATTAGAPAGGSSTVTAAVKKEWPDEAVHPPKGLEGNGNPTPTAPPLSQGVYFWSTFDGWHVRVVRGDKVNGLKIDVRTDNPSEANYKVMPSEKKPLPTGVRATQIAPGDLSLEVAPGPDPASFVIDVNGFIGQLTWTFDGVDRSLVVLGTSPNSIPNSPFTVTKR